MILQLLKRRNTKLKRARDPIAPDPRSDIDAARIEYATAQTQSDRLNALASLARAHASKRPPIWNIA
jgi:hypothetical protein